MGANPAAAPARQENQKALDFVSESDVRQALKEGRKVRIHSKTLLTPSARELGEEHQIFERT
jgi:hypothetical protein